MTCKHTRVWVQDIYKKSTDKKYWENTLLSINIVIDDRRTCNVNQVYMYVILVVSIYAFQITMGLLIKSSQKQTNFFHIEKDTMIKFRY